jgi:plastocyanin
VKIEANANDWTLTADGVAQAANKGVALIATGTTVDFASITGLHNIVLNGTVDGADLKQGDTRQITFNDPGQFTIECQYHPPMKATLFVE